MLLNHITNFVQNNMLVYYYFALIKKVCTNMAKEMNTSHDSMYRNFDNPIEKAKALLDDLKTMSLNTLNLEELYLIFDDTQITKLYAKQIEGLEVGFDGSF